MWNIKLSGSLVPGCLGWSAEAVFQGALTSQMGDSGPASLNFFFRRCGRYLEPQGGYCPRDTTRAEAVQG
jgi:hypothetical protein